jgi:hypothetical protein
MAVGSTEAIDQDYYRFLNAGAANNEQVFSHELLKAGDP